MRRIIYDTRLSLASATSTKTINSKMVSRAISQFKQIIVTLQPNETVGPFEVNDFIEVCSSCNITVNIVQGGSQPQILKVNSFLAVSLRETEETTLEIVNSDDRACDLSLIFG